MKIARVALLSALFLLVVGSTAAHAYHSGPRVSVSLSFFYDELAPYGHWYPSQQYDWVWRPAGVHAGWRPYVDGYWVYSDYGPTWVSDYEWGWAPFHYGRWYLDPVLGWVWVPGTQWAPAWVSFHHGGGWVGWAPLPPGAGFSAGFSYARHSGSYCFVQERHFLDRHIRRRAVPVAHNHGLLRRTRNVTRYATVNRTVVNRSVPVERIARATRRPVPTHRVVDVARAGDVRRARARAREVAMFRPAVRSVRPSQPPAASRRARPSARADGPGRRQPSVEARERQRRQSVASRPQRPGSRQVTRPAPRSRPRPPEATLRLPSRERQRAVSPRGPQRREQRELRPPTRQRREMRAPQRRPPEQRPSMGPSRQGPRQPQASPRPQRRPREQRPSMGPSRQGPRQPQASRRPQQRQRPAQSVRQTPRQRQPAARRAEERSGRRESQQPQRQKRRERQRGRPPGPAG